MSASAEVPSRSLRAAATASTRRVALFLSAIALCSGAARAQIELGPDEAPVRWAAGRPMVRATLRAGEKLYICHLLIDLAQSLELVLHRNAASVLRSSSCRVEVGNAIFEDLPFEARRDGWMESFTAEHAEELQEVPVAGALGLAAFASRDLLLDGPRSRLRLLPPRSASEPVEAAPELRVVELLGDPRTAGLRLELVLEGGRRERFGMHTREEFSWIDAALAAELGHADGVLRIARAGTLDFAARTPFRPIESAARKGSLGGAVLQGLVTRFELGARRIVFDVSAPVIYPDDEAAYYRARYGTTELDALRSIAEAVPPGRFSAAAADAWLERVNATPSDDHAARAQAFEAAGRAAIHAAPKKGRATRAIALLEALPFDPAYATTRRALAEAGLAESREDEDGTAAFKLRLALGRLALQRDDRVEAKRHLLASVFGMPTAGAGHLALAELHGRGGEWELARARSFQALLDARETGAAGYLSFLRAHRELAGKDADPLPVLEELADGRVPYFEALPRAPGSFTKTGKTALLELFTGAMCPPCVAADLAVDAASKHYDADELVVLQWHLPIPAPDPLFSPAAQARAERYAVRATPTTFLDGQKAIVPGGKVGDAPESFRSLRTQVDAALANAPLASIEATASRDGDLVSLTASCSATSGEVPSGWRLHAILVEELVVFPGSNGILFHHQVARASCTPASGVKAAEANAGVPWRGEIDLDAVEDELEVHLEPFEEREPFLVRPTVLDRRFLRCVVFVEDASSERIVEAMLVPISAPPAERGR